MMGGQSRSPPTWTRAASVASESLVRETSIPTTPRDSYTMDFVDIQPCSSDGDGGIWFCVA